MTFEVAIDAAIPGGLELYVPPSYGSEPDVTFTPETGDEAVSGAGDSRVVTARFDVSGHHTVTLTR